LSHQRGLRDHAWRRRASRSYPFEAMYDAGASDLRELGAWCSSALARCHPSSRCRVNHEPSRLVDDDEASSYTTRADRLWAKPLRADRRAAGRRCARHRPCVVSFDGGTGERDATGVDPHANVAARMLRQQPPRPSKRSPLHDAGTSTTGASAAPSRSPAWVIICGYQWRAGYVESLDVEGGSNAATLAVLFAFAGCSWLLR
jgi:hypothetical protein